MTARLLRLFDTLRTSFWFLPALMGLGAIVAATILVRIDHGLDASARKGLWIVYSGGADGAREVLATIAGSMITVAGVVFSITVVALSLASQQFGPRLLRNFMEDRGNQLVLGTFTALFVYCILVLRTIEGSRNGADAVVPHLSVTVAVGLAIVAVAVLIYYIHHVALSIQVDVIVARVAAELHESLEHAFADDDEKATSGGAVSPLIDERDVADIRVEKEGYVEAVAVGHLVLEAAERGALVELRHAPGEFVSRGMILARVTPRRAVDSGSWLLQNVAMGRMRTPAQDPEFSAGRLTEMALRALSPSLNDPFTAVSCVDRLTAAFAFAASRPLKSGRFIDDGGTVRLTIPLTNLERLAAASFHEIRQSAKSLPSVSMHLLSRIAAILPTIASEEARRILIRHARLIRDGLEDAALDRVDRQAVEARFDEVVAAVDGDRG
ncbi:MAG: DUF2254 domain-containing protein [Thermoanaerobaculia bacterium]